MEQEYEYGKYNHFELRERSPRRLKYLYIDTSDFLADAVFINHELSVKFGKASLVFPDLGYRIVFCTFAKRDRQKFLDSMADLERKMLLQGHEDYPMACMEIMTPLWENASPGQINIKCHSRVIS